MMNKTPSVGKKKRKIKVWNTVAR